MSAHNNDASNPTMFWTVCPYCFYMHEYSIIYEDCCLLCNNCNRGFHSVSVNPPSTCMFLEGKNHYRCCFGVFSGQYPLSDTNLNAKKRKDSNSGNYDGKDIKFDSKKPNYDGPKGNLDSLVTTSDDTDEDGGIGDVGVVKNGEECKESAKADSEGIIKSATRVIGDGEYLRSVSRNTKKVMVREKEFETTESLGDGVMGAVDNGGGGNEDVEIDEKEGTFDDVLEFFIGEDDIYVGLRMLD